MPLKHFQSAFSPTVHMSANQLSLESQAGAGRGRAQIAAGRL